MLKAATSPTRSDNASKRPSTAPYRTVSQPQPSSAAAASSSSLTESVNRVRGVRATNTLTASASSSSTSLPRSILQHRPQSVRSGASGGGDVQFDVVVSKSVSVSVSVSGTEAEGAVVFGGEQTQPSPRLRTLSGSSLNPGNATGRTSVRKRPLTPRSAGTGSVPDVPIPSTVLPRSASVTTADTTPPLARAHPRSPTSPPANTRLGKTPAPQSKISGSPSSTASNGTPPQRRPSLASPLPATPIIPSHLPKPAVRGPPAPLNLVAASTPVRHPHSLHAATGSLSSPHPSPLSSPSATQPGYGHHTQRLHSAPTPPSSYGGGSPQGHHTNPSQGHSQTTHSHQTQGWASHAQYISAPRAGPSSLPDSPSTNAMMKRLLAKPAPISHGFGSGASGSESEGARMGRIGPVVRTRTKTQMRGSGVRSEDETNERRGGLPPVDFDMNQDALNRDIAMLGQWMARQDANASLEHISPASSLPDLKEHGKEKEKEKRVRNVLRRKPSTANAKASASASPTPPKPLPPQQSQLPPLGSFSPLSISPLGLMQETFTKENTAFIHPPAPHTNASMHRSASASAALPTASRAGRTPSGLPLPSSPLHQQTAQARTSLHPPTHHLNIAGSTRSATSSQLSSRGSSPRRIPIVGEVISTGPINARLASSHHSQARASPVPLSPLSPTSPTSIKRISSSGKPTPAASLVEAYKKQEREREERRLTAEKERLERKEERDMALGPNRKAVAEAKALGSQASRRHSVSGHDLLEAERMHSTADRGLMVPVRRLGGLSADSTLTVNSYTTTSSGPRISDDYGDNAVVRTGVGFQEIEKLASSIMVSTGSPLPPSEIRRQEIRIRSPKSGGGEHEEEEMDVTPYYTVFGSSATRVAAASRPAEEGWAAAAYGQGYWDSDVLGRRPPTESSKEKKESLGRSLSRKVSGRWKKQGGTLVGTLIEEDRQGRAPLRGRASMQERRKGGSTSRRDETPRDADARAKMRNRRSLRLSIDKFSDLLEREPAPAVPPLVRCDKKAALAVSSKDAELNSEGDTECEKDDAKKPTRSKKEKEKDKATSSPSGSTGTSGGNKFWKLMRRISVGGLKEKYRDASLSPPPPVPALPKDFYSTLPALKASRSNDSSLKPGATSADLKKNKVASPSAIVSGGPKQPPPTTLTPQRKLGGRTPSQSRPSTTTRSSSPVSSDVASAKFFHRAHSAHSSASSIEEERPPLPLTLPKHLGGSMFLQHIVPPSEMGKDEAASSATAATSRRTREISVSTQRLLRPDDDWQIVRSPSVELPSLPAPPRRLAPPPLPTAYTTTTSSATEGREEDRSESPIIPSFSTTSAVNAFPSRRLSSTLSAHSRPSPSSPHASTPSSIIPSPSSAVSSIHVTPLPPPPRPLRSAQRPPAVATRTEPVFDPQLAGRKSESYIIRGSSPQRGPTSKLNRRSSGGLSATSSTATARALRRRSSSLGGGTTASSVRSLSISLTTPPASATTTTFTFREMGADATTGRALTEGEKAARWEDLLERSARAGGTLHLAGGKRVLASDRLKFPKW